MVAYSYYEIDHRIRRYAETMAERGDTVHVISLRWSEFKEKYGSLNKVNIFRIQKREYNEHNFFDYAKKNVLFFIRGAFFLLLQHLRYRYDLIHIHNVPDFLVFMGFFPKLMGAKIVFDIHDILPEFYCQKFNKDIDSCLARILKLVEKRCVRFADHVIAANEIWREKLIKRDRIAADKCTSILNYPNMKYFENITVKRLNNKFNIIYPGTISHHHGIDIAVKAMDIVNKKIPFACLHIYGRSGNQKYYESLKFLVDNLHLKGCVRFYDPVEPERFKEIYSAADIGIVPKRGGIFASEAFSTKILDFMASGLPIIASRTKIDEYYFDDSRILFFTPEDYEEMAQRIIELYEDLDKSLAFARKGKEFVEKNNWKVKNVEYLDMVNKLLENCRE